MTADNANLVFAATGQGLYRSSDGGVQWEFVSGLPQEVIVHTVAANPLDPRHILVGIEGRGISVSRDGGQTWQAGVAGLEPNSSIHDIVIDPINSQVVYTSDLRSGVYRSTDGGLTWEKINNGLRTRAALGLSLSTDGEHLYVATDGEGVFRLDLNGQPPPSAAQPVPESTSQAVGGPADDSKPPFLNLPCAGAAFTLLAIVVLVLRKKDRKKIKNS